MECKSRTTSMNLHTGCSPKDLPEAMAGVAREGQGLLC